MEVKEEIYKAIDRIECVDYRSAERAGEIEEALDSCVTRVRYIILTAFQLKNAQCELCSCEGVYY